MTPQEEARLRSLVAQGKTAYEMADIMERDLSCIRRRLKAMGLTARTPDKKPRRTHCYMGHDLTVDGACYQNGSCRACHVERAKALYNRKHKLAMQPKAPRPPNSPSRREVQGSQEAVNAILKLSDKLARGDYLNLAERHLLRCRINHLSRMVVL